MDSANPNTKVKSGRSAEDIVDYVIRDYERLAGKRTNFETQWREIAERTDPSGTQQFSANQVPIWPGQKQTSQILDSTAVSAMNKFGAILDSLLTPRNAQWHRLAVNNKDLMKNHDVAEYFENVTDILFKYRYSPEANFQSQNQKQYKSIGRYGTAAMFVDQLVGNKGIRYKNIHLGQIYIDENHQGHVDKGVRNFPMTARQAYQKWGDKLPETILGALDTNPDREFRFIHHVSPRTDDYDPNRFDYKGMPFVSYYVSIDGKVLLSEGGFPKFPFAISRYEQAEYEVYGRSPAMEVLPAIKTLNEQKKIMLKQGHRAVDPVLLAHDDGILDGFSLMPGAINPGGISAEGRAMIQALPVGSVQIGKEMMDEERAIINDAFLVNLFQILLETPQMTATEVLERAKEKGILISPTLGRQESEYLGPLIDREIDVLSQQGLLPPMPPLLREAKGEYQVVYDSPLTRAQKAEEASGLARALETALQVVNVTQDQSALDFFDFDVAIPELARIQGVPERFFRDPDAVAQIRANRAQNAQEQKLIQAGPAAAAIAKSGAMQRPGYGGANG